MKRSEAMDNLSDVVAAVDAGSEKERPQLISVYHAAIDLLKAESDLPWKVTDDVDGSVAAFESEEDARGYASEVLWDEAAITGPTQPGDRGEQKPTESKYMPAFEGDPGDCAFRHTPRLVPITDQVVVVDGKYYRVELVSFGDEMK